MVNYLFTKSALQHIGTMSIYTNYESQELKATLYFFYMLG